ncbi:uncharacterized protein LOC133792669 [Humulus lupulus]|uniref:uncharacterized protein LOC133792669 n=1 Tax=Humulus lupulus TaxID=3486 RepID=UPI002B403DC3|nr:uncharacterized protein LOC133792669 [Humulus lupulus]
MVGQVEGNHHLPWFRLAVVERRGGGGSSVRANATATETLGAPSSQVFSGDQWKALASLFGNMTISSDRLSGTFNGNLWIIDIGASNRITGNISILFDVKNILCPIGLPDRKKVVATNEGSVRLSAAITLQHDQTNELIGMGSKHDGLYYFKKSISIQAVTVDGRTSYLNSSTRKVKRKHKHLLNVSCALRFQANFPIYFWGESVLAAAHLINRTPSTILDNLTPFEKLFGHTPSYDAICVFGSLCFAHNQQSKGDKFESRSRKCIFVGYPFGKKGWRLYDIDKNEFFVSQDVKFFEDTFPFSDTEACNNFELDVDVDSGFAKFQYEVPDNHDTTATQPTVKPTSAEPITTELLVVEPIAAGSADADQEEFETTTNTTLAVSDEVFGYNGNTPATVDLVDNGSEEVLGHGMRTKIPSVLL